MKTIKLKLWDEYIEEYRNNNKAVEIRKKDYDLEVGDKIEFYDINDKKHFKAEVSYIRKGEDIYDEDWIKELIIKDFFIKEYLRDKPKEITLIYLANIVWEENEKTRNN